MEEYQIRVPVAQLIKKKVLLNKYHNHNTTWLSSASPYSKNAAMLTVKRKKRCSFIIKIIRLKTYQLLKTKITITNHRFCYLHLNKRSHLLKTGKVFTLSCRLSGGVLRDELFLT